LNLLGGLAAPSSGQVSFAGSELSSLLPRERARRVAFVRQETPLAFPIRVAQFVMLGRFAFASPLGFEAAKDREMVQWALAATSLERLANRRLDEISGGERQRAVLARALAQEPELLLLDEPTANLDLNFQIELLRLVRGMADDHGITAVAVMHELNLASEFSDYMLLLKHGRALRFGEPTCVLTRELLEEAYGVPVAIDRNPYSGRPRVSLLAGRVR
jgi:iron complex transport system ATP-binding protein